MGQPTHPLTPEAETHQLIEKASADWLRWPLPHHRLAILRGLSSRLHSRISRRMTGRDLIARLQSWIARIELLHDRDLSELQLTLLLDSDKLPPLLKRELRLDPLPFSIDLLTRPDRHWEQAILTEALNAHWKLSSYEYAVEADHIEREAERLERELWPRAIFLFTESISIEASGKTPLWKARWWFASEPGAEPRPPGGNPAVS